MEDDKCPRGQEWITTNSITKCGQLMTIYGNHCWHSEPVQVRHAIGRLDGQPYSEDEQEYCCHCNKKSILKKKFGPHPDHGKFYKGPFSFSVERNIIDD